MSTATESSICLTEDVIDVSKCHCIPVHSRRRYRQSLEMQSALCYLAASTVCKCMPAIICANSLSEHMDTLGRDR